MFKLIHKKRLYSIIKLLVIIAIIAILAVALLPAINRGRERARYARWLHLSQSNQMDPRCVGYWTFEEGGGVTVKNRALGGAPEKLDGKLHNDPEWIPVGDERNRFLSKPSLRFDGVDDWIDCGNDASLDLRDAITVEQWVKLTAPAPGYSSIVSKTNDVGQIYYGFHISMNTTNPYFITRINNIKYANSAAGALTIGQWYHLVGTWDKTSGKSKVYLNGILKGTIDTPHASLTGGITGHLRMGAYGGCYPGLIDEVAIFNVALDVAEIRKRYEMGRGRKRRAPEHQSTSFMN